MGGGGGGGVFHPLIRTIKALICFEIILCIACKNFCKGLQPFEEIKSNAFFVRLKQLNVLSHILNLPQKMLESDEP